jgi:hypothetical protein
LGRPYRRNREGMYELLYTSLVAQQKKQRRYAVVTGRSNNQTPTLS